MMMPPFLRKSPFESVLRQLNAVFDAAGVDDTHGTYHAIKIAELTHSVLEGENGMDVEMRENLLLAALLHDADDRKYFPMNKTFNNASTILQKIEMNQQRSKKIITIIDLVSFSKNGNNINSQLPISYYYIRYIDRLQAIGIRGLQRCYEYGKTTKRPIYCPSTATPKNREELMQLIEGREQQYMKIGYSQSVVDHIFDKLLHITVPAMIKNQYLHNLFSVKREQMIEFVLRQAQTGYVNFLDNLQKEYAGIKQPMYNLQFLNAVA